MFNQYLAQQGIVVWMCDNRSASGKGAESAWAAYKRLGESELADIEDGLTWLKQQPWVDGARIGISGWSYGGFMASYALTHSKSFAMGIAGGSVTDWHLYDSIYTERFMLMPQNNPDGYERTSVSKAAKNLSGRLLLLHGLMDDNVHAQNTVQLAYELQRAGKPFELMLYPRSRHGVSDPLLVKHMRATMVDFIMRTLKPAGASQAEGREEDDGDEVGAQGTEDSRQTTACGLNAPTSLVHRGVGSGRSTLTDDEDGLKHGDETQLKRWLIGLLVRRPRARTSPSRRPWPARWAPSRWTARRSCT